MRIGGRNEEVAIERFTIARDPDSNEQMEVWSTWGTFLAAVEVRPSREIVVENQIQTSSVVRFHFDYLDVDGVTAKDRIVFAGTHYDIRGVMPDLATKRSTIIEAATA